MIDTINLSILNIKDYAQTVQFLKATDKEKTETILSNDNIPKHNTDTFLAYNYYADNGNIIALNSRSFYNSPSSSYKISYNLNFAKNTLEFNISVPKYTMRTNVFQFLEYYNTNEYTTWKLFRQFVKKFVSNFPDKIKACDVAITRIDLCYNQIFNSYEDSKSYLKNLETNLKTIVRKPSNLVVYGDNGLAYLTSTGYYKIYHKGDEFKKHDARELQKTGGIDIAYLQKIADRTLRYETTIRAGKIKRLFSSDKAKYLFENYQHYQDSGYIPKYFTMLHADYCEKFTDTLFSFLWNEFINQTIAIQTTNNESKEIIFQKIRDTCKLNVLVGKKRNKREIDFIETALLSFHLDLKEVYKAGFMKESTYYKKKAMLKSVGLNTINTVNIIAIPPINFDAYKIHLGYLHNLNI